MKLAKSRLHTQRRHLDQKLDHFRPMQKIPTPPSGWIRAIRESLGMTTRQMGKHLGISGAAVTKMENRERSRSITLKDLERAATLFHCRVVYSLVPVESLESTLRNQAQKAVKNITEKTDHMMKLEEQAVEPRELKAQQEVFLKILLESLDPRIWGETQVSERPPKQKKKNRK